MKKLSMVFLTIVIPLVAFGLDFSFYNADLRSAINDIARTYNVQVIIADDVSGMIDMTFQAESFDEALQKVLLTTNYAFTKIGNVYLVGSMNSPDKIRATIYKPSTIFLKYITPNVAYDLLGVLSKYVLYLPNSNVLLIDADDQTKKEIADMISKIDVPNENRFFYYEIHEMSTDEYQRFRQIEQVNKSGILVFSGSSFEIFREVMKIKGTADIFGNVTIATIGEAVVNSTDPKFSMKVESNKNTVNVSLITGVNVAQISMTDQKSHAVAKAQIGDKNFLIFMGFADSLKNDFAFEEKIPQNKLRVDVFYNQTSSKLCGNVTYGSTDLSIVGEIYAYQTRQATVGVFAGVIGNLIDQMYAQVLIGIENLIPAAKFEVKDTTSIGIFRLKGEIFGEWDLNGAFSIQAFAGVGMNIRNMEMFGGIGGNLQTAGPYIEISLNYEWIRAKLLWEQLGGYTFGGGINIVW